MKSLSVLIALLCLAGCADSGEKYLWNISTGAPLDSFGSRSERMEKGKTAAEPGPFPEDFPPSRTIVFKDKRHYSIFAHGPVYAFPAFNVVRLYDLKNIGPDRTISRYVKDLKLALSERRDARSLAQTATSLPDFPPRNAGHLVQSKVDYMDFPWGKGVFYLVEFTQGPGNVPNNDELIYTFQGLGNDGRLYVAADFRVVSDLLAKTKPSNTDEAVSAISSQLDREPDTAFNPDLLAIRQWMRNLQVHPPHHSW